MKGQLDHLYKKGATVSRCGLYRYILTRCWDQSLQEVRWLMLNPSTADEDIDDPTVRKCVGFARRWGFGSIRIVNLFAFRATNPRDLLKADDPIGPNNLRYLEETLQGAVVVAWGGNVPKSMVARDMISKVIKMAPPGTVCLGRTKDGSPRHPLMLSYDTAREPWPGEPS